MHKLATVFLCLFLVPDAFAMGTGGSGPAVSEIAGQKVIQDIHWPQIDAYCVFRRKEQTFDYDDPDTWRFVYFTSFGHVLPEDSDLEADKVTAFARLYYLLRELQLVSEEETGDKLKRVYRTYSKPAQDVVLDLTKTEEGSEHTAYEGTMSVSGPFGSETIDVKGDCGF